MLWGSWEFASTSGAKREGSDVSADSLFLPNQGGISDLSNWIAGDLGSAFARLYTNNLVYLPTRVPADFTEAAFAGYSPQGALAWSPPFLNGMGKIETDSRVITFNFTAGSGTQPVFGLYVTDLLKTKLLLVMPFLMPFIFSPANNSLTRVIQLTQMSQL